MFENLPHALVVYGEQDEDTRERWPSGVYGPFPSKIQADATAKILSAYGAAETDVFPLLPPHTHRTTEGAITDLQTDDDISVGPHPSQAHGHVVKNLSDALIELVNTGHRLHPDLGTREVAKVLAGFLEDAYKL